MNPLFLLLFCGNNCGNHCDCRPTCDRPCVADCDRCDHDYDCHEPYIPECDCVPEDNCRECDDVEFYSQGRRTYPKDCNRRY